MDNIEFWTEKDLQNIFKIGDRQAAALIRDDNCPAIKIGRAYRVQADKFMDWINSAKRIKLDYTKL